jgi:uncharacterized protein (TIGR03437 family)
LPAGEGALILPASGTYTIEAAYDFNSPTNYNITLIQQQACAFVVAPKSILVPASGGTAEFGVTGAAGCDWLVVNNSDWLTLPRLFGAGAGAVSFTVAPNTAYTQRTSALIIGGQTVSVTQAGNSAHVSSASYKGDELARDSLVTAYGLNLATKTESSSTLEPVLTGTTVKVSDSAGKLLDALLYYASPTQINYLMPADAALGAATVIITAEDGAVATGEVKIADVAPSLFAANSDGKGLAAGVVLRVKPDGERVYEPIARYDPDQKRFVAVPIDLGSEGDRVYFIGFGTGFRFRTSLEAVSVKVGGIDASVSYAGAQGESAGLDQLNVLLPRGLTGRGVADVALTVDGKTANGVQLVFR